MTWLDGWLGPGLRKLLTLRVRGALRASRRRMATVGGVAVLVFLLPLWLGAFAVRITDGSPGGFLDTETLRRLGPAIFAVGWMALVTLRGGGETVGFTPAEADQLFSAPHREVELIRYKVLMMGLTWGVAGVFLGPLASIYTRHVLSGFLIAWLILPAVQLSAMILALLLDRPSRSGHAPLLAIVLLGLFGLATGWVPDDAAALLTQLEALVAHPVARSLLFPFVAVTSVFVGETTAELLQASLVLIATNAILVAAVLALGRGTWLEQAAEGAVRRAASVRRVQSGGLGAAGGTWHVWVPRLPRLWGVGPIAWRRIVELVRRPASLLGFLWPIGIAGALAVALDTIGRDVPPDTGFALIVGSLGYGLLFVPSVLRLDFRSDLERIEMLRSLPLSPIAVVVGQITPMVLMLTLSSWLVVFGAWLWHPPMAAWALAAVVVVPMGLVLTLAIENLVFLLLPWRIESGEATLQSVGRNLLTTMLSFGANLVSWSVTASFGIAAGLVSDRIEVGVAVTVALMSVAAVVSIGLAARRFEVFDPSRDVPT